MICGNEDFFSSYFVPQTSEDDSSLHSSHFLSWYISLHRRCTRKWLTSTPQPFTGHTLKRVFFVSGQAPCTLTLAIHPSRKHDTASVCGGGGGGGGNTHTTVRTADMTSGVHIPSKPPSFLSPSFFCCPPLHPTFPLTPWTYPGSWSTPGALP